MNTGELPNVLIPITDNIRTILTNENKDINLKYLQIEYLLDNGLTDVNENNNFIKTTPLMTASIMKYMQICELLIRNGADLNLQNISGNTVLMQSLKHGNLDITKFLLDHGADPNIKNRAGQTVLTGARERGYTEIVELIESHMKRQSAEQKLAFASSLNPRLGYDTPLKHLELGLLESITDKLPHSYDHIIHQRMMDESRIDKLTKARQHSAIMRGMETTTGPFSARGVRYEPSIMEGISRHLSNMRPNTIAQRNIRLEDEENLRMGDYINTLNQYGSGKKRKRKKKKKKKTKRLESYGITKEKNIKLE